MENYRFSTKTNCFHRRMGEMKMQNAEDVQYGTNSLCVSTGVDMFVQAQRMHNTKAEL